MIAYLDSSAIVKMIVSEDETEALAEALRSWPDRATSGLARTEVVRAVADEGEAAVRRARTTLSALALLPLGDAVLDAAGELMPFDLRSLDAIHLASALSIGERLGRFVSYDRRQLEAAEAAGMATASPR